MNTCEYYVVINSNTSKYVGYIAEANDWKLNPYIEHTSARRAYLCTTLEEAQERAKKRYDGIPNVIPVVARIVINVDSFILYEREYINVDLSP